MGTGHVHVHGHGTCAWARDMGMCTRLFAASLRQARVGTTYYLLLTTYYLPVCGLAPSSEGWGCCGRLPRWRDSRLGEGAGAGEGEGEGEGKDDGRGRR